MFVIRPVGSVFVAVAAVRFATTVIYRYIEVFIAYQ